MISAGAMNRRIRIEAPGFTRDPETNEQIPAWTFVGRMWAHRRDAGAREFLAAGAAENTETLAVFTVWFRDGITSAMRVVDRGQIFEITGTSEIGQRRQLQLQAKAVNSNATA